MMHVIDTIYYRKQIILSMHLDTYNDSQLSDIAHYHTATDICCHRTVPHSKKRHSSQRMSKNISEYHQMSATGPNPSYANTLLQKSRQLPKYNKTNCPILSTVVTTFTT